MARAAQGRCENKRVVNTRKFVFLHNQPVFFTFGLGGDESIAENQSTQTGV